MSIPILPDKIQDIFKEDAVVRKLLIESSVDFDALEGIAETEKDS